MNACNPKNIQNVEKWPNPQLWETTGNTDAKGQNNQKKEAYAVAPAPSRDYYALELFQNKFLWTRWKISHGPFMTPVQRVVTLQEFINDVTMQNELAYIFGPDTTSLIKELAHKNWTLTTMPSHILQKILSYVSVQDILKLSQVCKRLSKECSTNEVWQAICKNQWKILLHNDIEKASLIGWKRVYLEKMRPKRYKTDPTYNPKPNILHRSRVLSVSTLNTPISRASTATSSLNPNKRMQELKKSVRTTSEIFGKDFKATTTSLGKLTDRTTITSKTRTSSRHELRPFSSGKLPITPKPDRNQTKPTSRSAVSLMKLSGNPPGSSTFPRPLKSKVTSVRTRSDTSQFAGILRTEVSRPNTGRSGRLQI